MLETINQYAQSINTGLLLVILGFLVSVVLRYENAIKAETNVLKERINLLQDQLKKAETEDSLVVTERIKKKLHLTEDEYKKVIQEINAVLEREAMKDKELRTFKEKQTTVHQKIITNTVKTTTKLILDFAVTNTVQQIAKQGLLISGEEYLRKLQEENKLQQQIEALKRVFAENPDNYPEIPGQRYYIVVTGKDGNLAKKAPGPIARAIISDGSLSIMPLPEGSDDMYLCLSL